MIKVREISFKNSPLAAVLVRVDQIYSGTDPKRTSSKLCKIDETETNLKKRARLAPKTNPTKAAELVVIVIK